MKLAAFEVLRSSIPGPAARDAGRSIARDEQGREGVGEAAPIGGWSAAGETLAAVSNALHGVCGDIQFVDEQAHPLAAIERALAPHREILDACPTAAFAVETALLDLLAQRRGEDVASSLARALGAEERSGGEGVETSALLMGAGDGEVFVERGVALLARGFRVIKVKLRAEDDGALAREIQGLANLRRAAPGVELRLDPNGRWSVADARRRLAMLASLEPAFVEQPVPAGALAELGPCAVPWAADESLASPDVVERLSREGGCAAFVIKPAALGVRRALDLARQARARGLAITLTHFLDGPIGLAAACETALALASAGFELLACGLDPHEGLRALPRELLPHHRAAARIHPTGGGGLGLPRGALR